jgi:hypothetical protein
MANDYGWHKIGYRMWQRKRLGAYEAIIFGSPRYQLWAWVVWHEGGYRSDVGSSLSEARRRVHEHIAEIEQPGVSRATQ